MTTGTIDMANARRSGPAVGAEDGLRPRSAAAGPVPLGPLPASPLVSVIVPSFNQGKFVRATLESILAQSYRPLQIHVVDGASTDETVEVLRSFGDIPELQWTSAPDEGVVHAVNRGLARATGDIVGVQSSDDLYVPSALERIVAEFRSRPRVGLLYGDTVKVDEAGHEVLRYQIGPFSLMNLFLFKTWIPQPSAFFRREMVDMLGGWDAEVPYAPDTDLWIRMAFRTEVAKIDAYLSQRRMHGDQRDTQGDRIIRDYCKMIDRSGDLRTAPDRIRRASKASKHLIHLRYGSPDADWDKAWHLVRAGLECGEAWNARAAGHYACLPARRVLSRVKRRLLRRHRHATTGT